jgi:hypothetical protein
MIQYKLTHSLKFKPINETTLNSSSNVDLFTIFHQSVDFISNLQWPNYLQECRFNTALSKVIGIALQQYTKELEWLIRDDIYPNASIGSGELSGTFFDRAKHQLIGSRHHGHRSADEVPPDFLPRTCVLINNIEASRIKLDRLYQTMDVDDIAQEMRENPPITPQEKLTDQNQNYLYSIKIVRAENLPPLDNNGLSDPYVVLEIDGKPITRTRTMYETLNPRWDQTFDIWLTEETVDVLALVYDEDVIGANEECGGVWFKLSPTYFDDYQTHELVLNLHPQGTLYLRIDMEGEKDDIQYWFAKAFRTLKRTENDAAGLIVDRVSEEDRSVEKKRERKR